MTYIKEYVYKIEEEIEGAKNYAESYLKSKAENNQVRAKLYLEMAQDELKHVKYIHDIAAEEIERLSKIYTPPERMKEVWDSSHRDYVEKVAWIRQMLAM